MEYKYLKKWCDEQDFGNLVFSSIGKYQDQYAIFFRKNKTYLQISLASENCFCFFTDVKQFYFQEEGEINHLSYQLKGSKLKQIYMQNNDRIIAFDFEKIDISGNNQILTLILELIPHFENIILTEKQGENKLLILNSLRKFSLAENPQRQILPQIIYESPKSLYQNKLEPVVYPLSYNNIGRIIEETKESENFPDLNSLFYSLFYDHILEKRIANKRKIIISKLRKAAKKKTSKLVKLQKEFDDSNLQEQWRERAELLKGNFAQIKSGQESIIVINYYVEGFPEVDIPLKVDLSPRENINYYFKKFRKARDGKTKIKEQIVLTEKEVTLIKKKIRDVENLSPKELLERKEVGTKGNQKKETKYRSIDINENWEIVIGRTSTENDFLTTRLARPWDWWFHTRIFKGTHVILRNFNKKQLPEDLKVLCCRLAAYFSKAKKSSNVPVDYTEVRYVRKPRKSPPGYVIYKEQKTFYADPISMRDAVALVQKKYMIEENK